MPVRSAHRKHRVCNALTVHRDTVAFEDYNLEGRHLAICAIGHLRAIIQSVLKLDFRNENSEIRKYLLFTQNMCRLVRALFTPARDRVFIPPK